MASAAPTSVSEQWAARVVEAKEKGGSCAVCLDYFGHAEAMGVPMCSVCLKVVQETGRTWEWVVRVSPQTLLGIVGENSVEREKRAAQDLKATMDTMSHSARQVAMQPKEFAHFLRALPADTSPQLLARRMLEFGRPLVTAAQAKQLLDSLTSRGQHDYRYLHVLCSRVVDKWNLSDSEHGIGNCYYGMGGNCAATLAKLIGRSERENAAAVFWAMLRSRAVWGPDGLPEPRADPHAAYSHENFWSDGDVARVKADMRERSLDVVPNVVITCRALGGRVECTSMAGTTVCSFDVPEGTEPFGDWLVGKLCEGVRVEEGRLCIVTADGRVIWQGEGALSPFEAVCKRLRHK